MFRRRGRPFKGRPGSRQPGDRPAQSGERSLNPRWQREIRRANYLSNIGEHISAADIFLANAERARDRGFLGPAAFLFIQAGRALVLGEQLQNGTSNARTGLNILADSGHWPAFRRAAADFSDELEAFGQQQSAADIRDWALGILQGTGEEKYTETEVDSAKLPEKCPYCGASMSLEQVNARVDAAICRYCGSVVRGG